MNYDGFAELIDCENLTFVARAVGDNEDRPQFWYLKILEQDGGLTAIATDGIRLHKAVVDKIHATFFSPGYWRVLKNGSVKERDCETEDGLDYDKHHNMRVYEKRKVLWLAKLDHFDFFPADDVIDRLYSHGEPIEKEGVVTIHKYQHASMNALIKNLPHSYGINLNHLRDLGPFEWRYKIFSGRRAVLFEHKDKTALLMPLSRVDT
jgi:hypothetical protein